MAKDFSNSLNLPKTDFPMRANLPQNEPKTLEKWENEGIYNKMLENNEGKPLFILHDGPPFSNGNIHMGTALNKILKDFINKSKSMMGYKVPYIPGWDNHGMPIESAIIKKNKIFFVSGIAVGLMKLISVILHGSVKLVYSDNGEGDGVMNSIVSPAVEWIGLAVAICAFVYIGITLYYISTLKDEVRMKYEEV